MPRKTILLASYSAAIHASFGHVTREIFKRIFESGKYNIIQHGWFHMDQAEEVPWKIIPTNFNKDEQGRMHLDGGDKFGEKSFDTIIKEVNPDLVWVLADFYMVKHIFDQKKNFQTVPFILHIPVDGEPWHEPMVANFATADYVEALTEYGRDIIRSLMPKKPKEVINYIPHGVDESVFKKLDQSVAIEARKGSTNGNIDADSFVIGWVGKDQYRKQVWRFWELLYYLRSGNYLTCSDCTNITLFEFDKVTLQPRELGKIRMYDPDYDYSHCWWCKSKKIKKGLKRDNVYGWSHMAWKPDDGWNPNILGVNWGIKDNMYMTHGLSANKGLNAEDMAKLYNMFDCFYCMSGGEGFGIPVLEAMACEVPIVYTNYSGHAEVVGDAGLAVNTNFVCEMNSCFDRAAADTADAVKKTLSLIENKELRDELGTKGRERALTMTWDIVAKQWEDRIDEIASSIKHSLGVVI